MGFRGCSLAVRRKDVYFKVPAKAFFGEMSCWDGIQPKRGKHGWGHLMHVIGVSVMRASSPYPLKVRQMWGNKTRNFVWEWRVLQQEHSEQRQQLGNQQVSGQVWRNAHKKQKMISETLGTKGRNPIELRGIKRMRGSQEGRRKNREGGENK